MQIGMFGSIYNIRIVPYPPSFNRMAANTIEPAIGASTCAFGNHRCTVNIGSFTINPEIRNTARDVLFNLFINMNVIIDLLLDVLNKI